MLVAGVVLIEESDDFDATGTMTYDELQNMLDSGGAVVMSGDIQLANGQVLTITKKVDLDMNGRTITVSSDFVGRPFEIRSTGTLTVHGNGVVDTSASNSGYGSFNNYGTLTVEDGRYTGKIDAGGSVIYNRPGGILTVNGGSYYGTPGAIVNSSIATINGGSFIGETCSSCSPNNWCYTIRNISSESRMVFNGGTVEGIQGALSAAIGYLEVNGGEFLAHRCLKNHLPFYACYAAGEYGDVEVHINGGYFESSDRMALYIGNDNTNGDGGINAPASGYVTGGEFHSGGPAVINVAKNTGSAIITGGSFDREIPNTLPEGFGLVEKGDLWYVASLEMPSESGSVITEESSISADMNDSKYAEVTMPNVHIVINGASPIGVMVINATERSFTQAPQAVASYEISIISDASEYVADITVDAQIPNGHRALAYYIDESGDLIPVEVVNYTSSTVTFRTTHTTPFVIMSEEIPATPSVPDDDEDDYPFIPGQNVPQTSSGSDDGTTLVAAAAAVVVIMLAVVAIMATRNH